MNGRCLRIIGLVAALALAPPAQAAGDLTVGESTRISVRLGTTDGLHRLLPDTLAFETGKLYALRIDHPGRHDCYFGSQGFADAVYSRKVVVLDASGRDLVQVYGPVRRFELKAGSSMEWWFVPVRAGIFEDLRSTRTHDEAGMKGRIEVR